MNRARLVIFGASVCLLFSACAENPAVSPPIASEKWRLNDGGTRSQFDMSLNKFSNGAYSATGSVYCDLYGSVITGAIQTGHTTIAETEVSIRAQGTAQYPGSAAGNGPSEFTLRIDGTFSAGSSHGTWQIDFTGSDLQGRFSSGSFSGQLQSGSGVTAP